MRQPSRPLAWMTGLGATLAALGVLGYHPYAEDGGLYLAEVKRLLDPELYPHDQGFVSGHLGGSLFAGSVAWCVRVMGIPLDVMMAAVQAWCVGGVLLGVWRLARVCYAATEARWGAVGLVTLAMGMPVAGTSLMLMDPYATARSVSTALTVLGLAALVEMLEDVGIRWRGAAWTVAAFAGALLAHPLMGGYGVAAAVVMVVLRRSGWVRVAWLAAMALGLGWAAQALAAGESADYARVMATRYYWFLAEWRWFEWVGLVAPMAILGWVGWRASGRHAAEVRLARMAVVLGGLAVVVAGVFAREGARGHAVARMQPLRCLLVVYVVMLVVLGARIGEWVLQRSVWRWMVAGLALGGGMFAVQRATYPASDHLELPGLAPRNAWEQAFVWVRQNTPKDAVFALDADYVHRAGEDAQGFRSIAARDALPDFSKDGGQASIRPELTGAWVAGQQAQARLSGETDAERRAALQGTGASWVVLGLEARTGFRCPFDNGVVKVCRLEREER